MIDENVRHSLKMLNGKEVITSRDNPIGIMPDTLTLDFKCDNCHEGDGWRNYIPYDIKLNDHGFPSRLPTHGTNPDQVRQSIENYIFAGSTKIDFSSKDSSSAIQLERQHIVDKDINPNGATNLVRVEIIPDIYLENGCHTIGFCEEKQVIREIYESLLNVWRLAIHLDDYYDIALTWDDSPMTFYNKFKSPIIENYICGKKLPRKKTVRPNMTIDHVLSFFADFSHVFIWDELSRSCGSYDWNDDAECYTDEETYKMHLTGLCDWHETFEKTVLGNKHLLFDEDFDSDAWNLQGMSLVADMRKQLPPNIDLWYDYTFEDYKNRGKRAILVYNE